MEELYQDPADAGEIEGQPFRKARGFISLAASVRNAPKKNSLHMNLASLDGQLAVICKEHGRVYQVGISSILPLSVSSNYRESHTLDGGGAWAVKELIF